MKRFFALRRPYRGGPELAGRRRVKQISEIANAVLDPLLAKRAGINTTLLAMWPDIVGADFADCTRPERIKWPRRSGTDDGFVPGTLTIACEGARALFLAHAQDQLIQRLNGVFGFPAISSIRIVQKPVNSARQPRPRPDITEMDKNRLDRMVAGIDDPRLRAALERLGTGVIGRARKSRITPL